MENKTLLDLNDRLFAQLDRISNPELSGEALKDELARTSAVIGIGKTIVDNGNLALRAAVAQDEKLGSYPDALPKMLQVKHGPKVQ